ncbi:hypothetical protein HOD08_04860 [bacterium]|nr:hypothetical protein [bacterium]
MKKLTIVAASILLCAAPARVFADVGVLIDSSAREHFLGSDSVSDSPLIFDKAFPGGGLMKEARHSETVVRYVKNMFNTVESSELELDASSFLDFTKMGSEVSLDMESAYTCLRLFYNKMKGCEALQDSVTHNILEALPEFLARYFEPEQSMTYSLEFLRKDLERRMVDHFTNHKDQLSAEPTYFFAKAAREISTAAHDQFRNPESPLLNHTEWCERLRQVSVRLVELCLGKTVWCEQSFESIIPSFTRVGYLAQQLAVRGILTQYDDLDDIYWSLCQRFKSYLKVVGHMYPVSFFENAEDAVVSGEVFFLEGEQDDGIKGKAELIFDALRETKLKAMARDKQDELNGQAQPGPTVDLSDTPSLFADERHDTHGGFSSDGQRIPPEEDDIEVAENVVEEEQAPKIIEPLLAEKSVALAKEG